jgi:hypothetical protein
MSQFSQTKKASSSSLDDSEDDTALKELDDEDGEEPEELVMEDGDKIDPAVESSDSAMVDEAAAETDADDSLPQLTHEQVNLGQFSLSKVCIAVNTVSAAYSSLDSSEILQNASSTAPPSVQIWSYSVRVSRSRHFSWFAMFQPAGTVRHRCSSELCSCERL